ncbi:MAG: ribonuclease III [Geminicoccaceae bacterium]|nr:ribonuclease III [Geminicoccaceae bacterium]
MEHPLRAPAEPHQLSDPSLEAARAALEERLGHRFADRSLLACALTHESAAGGARGRRAPESDARSSNERLEFLGDRVLALVVAELLMRRFPNEREGPLTHRLIALVKGDTLAEIGRALALDRALEVGGGRGRSAADPRSPSLLGNTLEALIGAVYLDGGLEAARRVVERLWADRLDGSGAPPRHPKQALQERIAERGLPPPVYTVAERKGPDHAPRFTIAVEVEGLGRAEGEGPSKRAAEEKAAERLLARLEGRPER